MSLFELVSRPAIASPVLVVGLDGWIDAGVGGATALTAILQQTDMEPVAVFDTDSLLDHRARRPTMHLIDGVNDSLSWPAIELRVGADQRGNEALFLLGAEPDHSWRAFSDAVVELAVAFDVRLLVGLGAYPAPVPHTRSVNVVATATTAELARQVGFVPGNIAVPAGIHAAIERRCAEQGIPAVGLWAQVPHYAAGMPYQDAGVALLQKLASLTGLQFDPGDLDAGGQTTRARLSELIAGNPEHLAMIRQLEEHYDDVTGTAGMNMVTGDDLVAEVEKFLEEQG